MNRSDDHDPANQEVHAGHTPETGLLAGVREWTDVFPWLRLGRTLRVAGSPTLVASVAVTLAVWWLVPCLLFGSIGMPVPYPRIEPLNEPVYGVNPETGFPVSNEARHLSATVIAFLEPLQPTSVFYPRLSWWDALLMFAWSVLIWSPVILMMTRQGALLTAGRPMIGLAAGWRAAWRRSPTAWLSAAIPLACVLAIGGMIIIIGWLSRPLGGITWIEFCLAGIVALIAIPCGILAFGANFAIPLSWAAIANEREADALDSLSRGYEYLLRRPLRLALYLLISFVAMLVVSMLAKGIAAAAAAVAHQLLYLTRASPEVSQSAMFLLACFPLVVSLTLFWSLVGGVYLLLRYDAGGQEVEDLWQPEPEPKPPLPQLSGSAEDQS